MLKNKIIYLFAAFILMVSCSDDQKENESTSEIDKATEVLNDKFQYDTSIYDNLSDFEEKLNSIQSTQGQSEEIEQINQNSKLKVNKIEPLPFANKSNIPAGDTVGLKVMVAAYDSTEEMKSK